MNVCIFRSKVTGSIFFEIFETGGVNDGAMLALVSSRELARKICEKMGWSILDEDDENDMFDDEVSK